MDRRWIQIKFLTMEQEMVNCLEIPIGTNRWLYLDSMKAFINIYDSILG